MGQLPTPGNRGLSITDFGGLKGVETAARVIAAPHRLDRHNKTLSRIPTGVSIGNSGGNLAAVGQTHQKYR